MEYSKLHKCSLEVNFTPAKINRTFRPQNDLNIFNLLMMSNVCTFIFK